MGCLVELKAERVSCHILLIDSSRSITIYPTSSLLVSSLLFWPRFLGSLLPLEQKVTEHASIIYSVAFKLTRLQECLLPGLR
jgi:hypothetical protein